MRILFCLQFFALTTNAFLNPTISQRQTNVLSNDVEVICKASSLAVEEKVADVYTRFGASKDEIAIDFDISDLLQWVGTKEDITERVMKDNKEFKREFAEKEVSKLLLDSEVLGRLVFYEKNKEEIIRRRKQAEEESLSNPTTLATYATWLIGGASLPLIRKTFIDPKFESGEWSNIEIALPKFTELFNSVLGGGGQ
mmetsp:Transcript_7606/g.8363  ORF Transcript_7606/g.8363 Transcript_7606/m.8363 type:complete len:197 (-) Transcript_7606:83-673(-)|eukprot:CAMPEP_0194179920 /NCGR_PEP_ID=MMETSP0154-20130528/13295_1 /TAXON_ID=1049557 /ORGANISM="Thalassiothrix antarctica, Strain L6-D1" /LENGTH=196 /DNA_ID=CAMNT_0038895451 /DNA_START=41 /DNA_END=631 /DNA_ORIENTATION=-